MHTELQPHTQLECRLHINHTLHASLRLLAMPLPALDVFMNEELRSNPLLEEADGHVSYLAVDAEFISPPPSLKEHLMMQVRLNSFSSTQRRIAYHLLDYLDDEGFLSQDCFKLPAAYEEVRQLIMRLDPIGCLSKHTQEYLLVQLDRQGHGPCTLVYQLVDQYFEALCQHQWKPLIKKLGITETDISHSVHILARLALKPGSSYFVGHAQTPYLIPDVQIDFWPTGVHVEYLHTRQFTLHSPQNIIQGSQDISFLREKYQAGVSLLSALQQRERTLTQVARAIATHQQQWLQDTGPLLPLDLHTLSAQLGLHVSTISRAMADKYASTPKGIISLKSLLSQRVQKATHTPISQASIKENMRQIIAQETNGSSLSDTQIVQRLYTQGISISRRTVAKYRAQMNILPVHLRGH